MDQAAVSRANQLIDDMNALEDANPLGPGERREVVSEWTRPTRAAICCSTIQFAWGGLIFRTLVESGPHALIHLAPDWAGGGCGPILCGLDRHDRKGPGWSWRGGLSPMRGEVRPPCPECAALRDPSLVVVGVDRRSFAEPWADHGGPADPVWNRARPTVPAVIDVKARADHAERCERIGPPPQASFESCPFRATHLDRARLAAAS